MLFKESGIRTKKEKHMSFCMYNWGVCSLTSENEVAIHKNGGGEGGGFPCRESVGEEQNID